jgi:antitoxin (DNA-binding transcriptional repressor) of toxin-antitoxin stability system
MDKVKTVGLKQLKKNLSTYLKEARSGVRILITDRNEWVAELREPDMAYIESHHTRPAVEDEEVQLFRSLSREARVALLMELEKV